MQVFAGPPRDPLATRPPLVKNSQEAFDAAQETDPGEACVFLANLDNNLSDWELWERIHREMVKLGLEGQVLVVVKENDQEDVTPSAHIQLKTYADSVTAFNHFDDLQLGERKVRSEGGKGHLILAKRINNGRPIPERAAKYLAGQAHWSVIALRITDFAGGEIELLDYNPGVVFEFKTVALRHQAWKSLKLTTGRDGQYVTRGGYIFWTP